MNQVRIVRSIGRFSRDLGAATLLAIAVLADIAGCGKSSGSSPPPPPAPQGLRATPGAGRVNLSWAASEGATAYQVFRSRLPSDSYNPLETTVSTAFTDATVLWAGTTYQYVVRAEHAGAFSENSNEASGWSQTIGNGTFQAQVTFAVSSESSWVEVADLNGDGILDLWVQERDGDYGTALLGKGDGTFEPPRQNWAGPLVPYNTRTVGDFNGDGKMDVAEVQANSDTVRILLGKGDGTFQAPVTYAAGSFPAPVVVSDFNGDGKLDLGVGSIGELSILLGNGDGTFQPEHSYHTGTFVASLAVGDFNGDGKPDLVLGNDGETTISIMLENGDGTFQNQVRYTVGTTPVVLAVGDFNGDGKLDLAVLNAVDHSVSVLRGN